MKNFKSGKQRGMQIKAARRARQARRIPTSPFWSSAMPFEDVRPPKGTVLVNPSALGANNSCGQPIFVWRSYYVDLPFRCIDCGVECVWTAERQRWWYEIAKGNPFSTACRCASCRFRECERKAEARRRSLAGLLRKVERMQMNMEE